MNRNNRIQRPILQSRHTSQLPLLMNTLHESYTVNTNIPTQDALTTPPTHRTPLTHDNNNPADLIPQKNHIPASSRDNDMLTSTQRILTDVRVSCAFIDTSELAKKVKEVIDEAQRRRFEVEYYGKSQDPSMKSPEGVHLPPFATEFFAKNMDIQRSQTPVLALDNSSEVDFRRIENPFTPGSSLVHEITETSWDGDKKVYFGPADDISYFKTNTYKPCLDQRTRHSFSGGSQDSDSLTFTSLSHGWSPLGGDTETPQPRETAAPAATADSTEVLLASLGVTESSKPVANRPLPPYQPLPEHSSSPLDGQRTPKSFADLPTLSESSQGEIRGRRMSWSSSSTIRANSREKHRNYRHTYTNQSPNTAYSPIDKRVSSPDWTELERQKTRALNLRLNGSQVLHKLKGKHSHSTMNTNSPSKLRKVPAIRSFAILDTPAAFEFTAKGMKHDLEAIAEETESVIGTQACDLPIGTHKKTISEPYNQETDSDGSGVLFMKKPTKRRNLEAQTRAAGPEQELLYCPLPEMEVCPSIRRSGSQESLATTIADTEESDRLLTKVPARKGKHWAQEICDGYEYHLLRHTNTPSIRESWSKHNGVFVIGTDEENQALLAREYSPASPRIDHTDCQSMYKGNEVDGMRRIRTLCRTDSIPEIDLDVRNSEGGVPMTPPVLPRSFEEHQQIKHGLVSGSYSKIPVQIPGNQLCQDTFSNSKGVAEVFGNCYQDDTFSSYRPYDLLVNPLRIGTDTSGDSNPPPEARTNRRGNDSGYSSRSSTSQQNLLGQLVSRILPQRSSDDDANATRGRTTTRGRALATGANNRRQARSQQRRGTGRVSFAPLPDIPRERRDSEGHIYHKGEPERTARERSPSPNNHFDHENYKYDEEEKPKIELPPLRAQPLEADTPPLEDPNEPVRAISSQPHLYVHQLAEQAQRPSDPMDLNNFVLPGGAQGGGKGKGGVGGQRSMRAMFRLPRSADFWQMFNKGLAFGKRSSSPEVFDEEDSRIAGKGEPVWMEDSTSDWHRPLPLRSKASGVGGGELVEDDSSFYAKKEAKEKEDKSDDAPFSNQDEFSETDDVFSDNGDYNTSKAGKVQDSPPQSPPMGLSSGNPSGPPSKPFPIFKDVTEDDSGLHRYRVGTKDYFVDKRPEVVDIHFHKQDALRHERLIGRSAVNVKHVTTISPSSKRARERRSGLGGGSTGSGFSPCSRCGKVPCVYEYDGSCGDDLDPGLWPSLATDGNKDTHGSDDKRDNLGAFGKCGGVVEQAAVESLRQSPVAFPASIASTDPLRISEINKERLDLIESMGSFNAFEYERQDKRDPEFSEDSEAFEMRVSGLASLPEAAWASIQYNPRIPTLGEMEEIWEWLEELSALEKGPEPRIDDIPERTTLHEAIARTVQYINDLVYIRKIAPTPDDCEESVGQHWQDRWREVFLASLAHLYRLLEQDDDRRENARIDRQLREQELEDAKTDRAMEDQEREMREQQRQEWYEWLKDVEVLGDVEWVQGMVAHLVAHRISQGMWIERTSWDF